MATLGNKFRTQQVKRHSNMTELNHLGAMLAAKPHVFEGKMNQIFSSKNYFSDNSFSALAHSLGAEETISNNEWEWKMRGATQRPLVVLENVEPASNITPGRGRTTFKIKLDESWYLPGDVITPGTAGHKYQCRIQEEVQKHGNGFVYTVRLVSDDFNAFLPVYLLQPGQQWTKLYSTYGEGDSQDGSTQYASHFSLRDSLGKFRKRYSVTDYAAEEALAVNLQTDKGPVKTWIGYAEVEYWKQWYRELEIARWYNRKAKSVEAVTGRSVDSFSGIQEKLEDSHVHYYTELTARLIEEFLMDIFYSRTKPGAGRKIKAFTGEYGMLLFHRAMQDLMEKGAWTIANNSFNPVTKTKSEYSDNAYAVGYQFTKYIMHNGAELELIHNPLYDDTSINFEIDPITGKPVESMRFTFLDFSGEDGAKSNIRLISKKNGYKFGYVAGLVTPYGPAKGGLMSHSGEYYSMHVSKEMGIQIDDITKCGELILKRNIG